MIALPRWTLALLLAAAIGGCASHHEAPPLHDGALPVHATLDASYDWHSLLIVPFGTRLKDVPLSLHEVLLFRDGDHNAAAPDDPECYAADGTAPRFVGSAAATYLLCFQHDRLSRIEASTNVGPAQAHQLLADACALWLKNTSTPAASLEKPDSCEGHEGGTRFSGRMIGDASSAQTSITVTIDGAPAAN